MKFVLTLTLSFFCLGLCAQGLKIDSDILTRGELRWGGLPTNEEEVKHDHANFILERTMLGLDYSRDALRAKVTAQHSGTWGSAEANSLNIYEAWVELRSQKGCFAKVGRQDLSYDDQRIFGSDSWAMTAMSHDVLKLGYENKFQKIHVIGAFNQNVSNINGGTYFSGGLQPYKSMEAVWYHLDVPKVNLGASLIFFNVSMQASSLVADQDEEQMNKTFQQQMVGTYLNWTPKKWNAEFAYYRQMGDDENGIPIKAWMTSLKLTFTPNKTWRVYTGYDRLSGDENFATPPSGRIGMIQHKTIRGFNSIYGSHHKFYGAMDFFYVTTYVGGFTPGLQNTYVGGVFSPKEKYSFSASYHFLATETKLQSADKPLGHEVELSASYTLMKDVTLSCGYSFMRGTKTMEVLKRSDKDRQLQWAWLMLRVTPRFL